MTTVAQVEALGPLENTFLENGHSLSALGPVEPVSWPDAFPNSEDDLDLGPFSLPDLPLQTKDVSDVETEPVEESPLIPPEGTPAGAPMVLNGGDVAASAAEEQLVLPPEQAAPQLPSEPEPSEGPKPDVMLEATVEAEAESEGRAPEASDSSLGLTPPSPEQRPPGSGDEAEGPDPSAAPHSAPEPLGDGPAQAHGVRHGRVLLCGGRV